MNKTKNIKFYFYKVEKKFSVGLYGDAFKDFFAEGFSLDHQLMDMGDNKAFLYKINDNIFSFQKLRKDYLPEIKNETTGEVSCLKLRGDEALLEQSYLYWDFAHDIIIYQNNQEGFSPSIFEKYIKWVFKDKLDGFILQHIARKEGIEQILDTDTIAAFEFTIASPNPRLLKELGLSLDQIKDFDLNDINTLELKITSKQKRGFVSSTIKRMLNFNFNKNNFKKLKLKTLSSVFDKGQTIDLIDKFYSVCKDGIRVNEKTKSLEINDIITILNEIYDKNIKDVLELI